MQKSRERLYFTGIVGGGEKKATEKKKRKQRGRTLEEQCPRTKEHTMMNNTIIEVKNTL